MEKPDMRVTAETTDAELAEQIAWLARKRAEMREVVRVYEESSPGSESMVSMAPVLRALAWLEAHR